MTPASTTLTPEFAALGAPVTEVRRTPLTTAAAWMPAQLARDRRWIYPLDSADIAELDATLALARAGGLTPDTVTRGNFPLPRLAPRLIGMRKELENGYGAVLIKGLPVDRWSEADAMLVYAGLGVQFGELTAQNAAGRLLDHVRSTGRDWDTDPTVRGYQTTAALPFHCDKADLVGLMCLRHAKSGGASCITSSVSIYNAVLARRPDLVEALYAPLYVDLRGEEPEGMKPYYLQPLYGYHNGRLYGRLASKYVESAQRFPEVPRLAEKAIEATAYVESLAQSDEFRFDMVFERGDVQLLNNHVVVHSRRAYEDYPEPERWRHLVRMLMFTDTYRDVPAYVQHVNNVVRWWRAHPKAGA